MISRLIHSKLNRAATRRCPRFLHAVPIGLGSLVLTIAVTGCRQESAPASPTDKAEAPGSPVAVCTVFAHDFQEKARGIGTLEASQTVELRPEVSGTLEEVAFDEGAAVPAGALLFKIDDTKLKQQKASAEAQLKAARARLENARRNYRRLQTLFERGSISEDERDQAETTFETGQAEVERLEAEIELIADRLEDTALHAPFAGIISEATVDPGDYVDIGDHLATLYKIDTLEVAFYLPETYAGQVKLGQPVKLALDAFPDKEFAGTVSFVAPSITPQSRDLLVKGKMRNSDQQLRPGAFARASVVLATHADQPTVPEDALVPLGDGYVVYLVQDGKAVRRDVQVGLRDNLLVEIKQGLKGGEIIVKTGQMKISDGSRVEVKQQVECLTNQKAVAAEPNSSEQTQTGGMD